MNNKITIFEELRVWQEGHELTLEIYKLTKLLPREETYGITSQLRRCSSSVPANIVEGFYRHTTKELIQFLYNARGSSGEAVYFLVLARDLNYISLEKYKNLRNRYENLIKSINAFIKSLKSK